MDTIQINRFLIELGRLSAQAGILVLLVLIAQWLFRKRLAPRWRSALWLLVVLRLVMPFSLSSATSIFNLLPDWPRSSAEAPQQSAPIVSAANAAEMPVALRNDLSSPAPMQSSVPEIIQPPAPAPVSHWPEWVLAAWLVGVVLLGGQIAVSSIRFWRRCRKSLPVSDSGAIAALEKCCEQLRVKVRPGLIECAEMRSPGLHGLLRPRLLLPKGFTTQFSSAELQFVFLHELAHLKRRDLLLNWVMAVLQVVHWFNPLVWLGFSRWRADREMACDAMALEVAGGERNQEYGRTILRLLENFAHPVSTPDLVGILEDKRQLHRRITMIAGYMPARGWPMLAAVLAAGLAAIGLTDARSNVTPSERLSVANSQSQDGYDMHLNNHNPISRGAGVTIVAMPAPSYFNGQTDIRSDNDGEFNLKLKKFSFRGNVRAENPQMKLRSELLTVESPELPAGNKFNRATAETNVVIHWVDENGTNHATAAKAVYTYILTNLATLPEERWQTSAVVVLSGNSQVVDSRGNVFTADPINWDRINGLMSTPSLSNMTLNTDKTNSQRPSGFTVAAMPAASNSNSWRAEGRALAAPTESADDLIGAWVLVGTPDKIGKAPKSGGRLKFYTGKTFCATQADPKTGVVIFHHGGTYERNGNEYVEKVNYANPTTMDFIGGTNGHFNIKVEGDTLTLIGIDNKYREVWKRADKPATASQAVKDMIGTWVYVGEPDKSGDVPTRASFKFITATDWCDTGFDVKTGVVILHHGGTWAFKGKEYVETVKYANPLTMDMIGQGFRFDTKLEGDTLTMKGIGNPWNQVWKRVK
jgi:beta-lactamase regulating signal transducer with metallopeptidase domain/lipopolysaccharide export system protein LptA